MVNLAGMFLKFDCVLSEHERTEGWGDSNGEGYSNGAGQGSGSRDESSAGDDRGSNLSPITRFNFYSRGDGMGYRAGFGFGYARSLDADNPLKGRI